LPEKQPIKKLCCLNLRTCDKILNLIYPKGENHGRYRPESGRACF
jgi:hypothetical protein